MSIKYRDGIPVAPGGLPIVGHLPRMARNLPVVLRSATERVGPLFWISGPAGQRILFWTDRECLELLKNKLTSSDVEQPGRKILVGEALITRDGTPHKQLRSVMNAPFVPRGLSASRIGEVMAELIEARVRTWTRRREIKLLSETQELTLDIIFRIMGVTSQDVSWWRSHYRSLFSAVLLDALRVPTYRRRAEGIRKQIDDRMLGIIRDARQRPPTEGDGLVAALVHGRDETGRAVSDEELLDNMRLLVLAGYETTANAMAWVALSLAAEPRLFELLQAEACTSRVVPTTPQQIKDYPLSEGLFREALRLHPPMNAIFRKAGEGLVIRGHAIKPGTMVAACITLLLRDKEDYSPDPERFNPERWKGRPITTLETLPFGAGPHFCLGYHLASMEIIQFAVILARELKRAGLRPRLVGGRVPKPVFLPLTRPPLKTKVAFVD